MADPVTLGAMAAISIGGTILGTALNAEGTAQQTSAQVQQLQFQSAIAQRNQQIAQQNADWARGVGEVNAQQAGLKTRAELGTEKATQGASNLDVNFGSAPLVRDSTRELGYHGQSVIRSDAAERAYSFEQQGVTAGLQSQMYQAGAANTQAAGGIKIASTIIGGATSVASKWLAGSTTGLTGSGNAFLPSESFMNNQWGY